MASILIYNEIDIYEVYAQEYSGTCGDEDSSVTWTLDTATKILRISGNGAIKDFFHYDEGDTEEETEVIRPIITEEWHAYKSKIEFIMIDEGITSIGSFAFYGLSRLQYIYFPDTLTDIKDHALKNCKILNNVTIPPNVTHIGERAFGDCNGIEKIVLPEGLPVIDRAAFKDCRKLVSVKLPSTLTCIDALGFYGCESLESIVIPEGVQTLGGKAFKKCSKLVYVYLPSTISNIEQGNFEECTSLRYINIPHGVKKISTNLFHNCGNLQRIILPITVTSILPAAFDGCEKIQILGATEYVENYAVQNNIEFIDTRIQSNNLIYAPINNREVTVVGYSGKLFSANIPKEVNGYKVTSIWNKAFEYSYDLTSITIPSTITKINNTAFRYCYDLVEVTNNSSLEIAIGSKENGYVGYYAANIRTSVDDQTILLTDKDGFITTYINDTNYIIGYKGNESNITLPLSYKNIYGETVEEYYIYKYAFAGNENITNCIFNTNICGIGHAAFYNNTNLISAFIPESITTIENHAFRKCGESFSISGYEGTTAQGYATANKHEFHSLEAPEKKLPEIDSSMVSLEYETIEWTGEECNPEVTVTYNGTDLLCGVDYITEYANNVQVGIATVTITGTGEYTGTVMMNYKIDLVKNHSYEVGDYQIKVTGINEDGLTGTASVKDYLNFSNIYVVIEDTIDIGGVQLDITEIGKEAFYGNDTIKKIDIGHNVTKISVRAFYGCSSLKRLNIYSEKLNYVGTMSIKGVYKKMIIRVPVTKKKKYSGLFTGQSGYASTTIMKTF